MHRTASDWRASEHGDLRERVRDCRGQTQAHQCPVLWRVWRSGTMLNAGERGNRNPGAMLTAHELPPTLVEHGVVAQAKEHEVVQLGGANVR
jgi:hypothetical protein